MRRLPKVALLAALLAVGCGRQSSPDAARTDVQCLMEKQMGQKLNASSTLNLAEVEGKLRIGMAIEEFDHIIAKDNKGPNESTKVLGGPVVEGDPPKIDPKKGTRTYFLRDVDLIVVTEFVAAKEEREERIVSWRAKLLRGD
jgi:hypothetical protein